MTVAAFATQFRELLIRAVYFPIFERENSNVSFRGNFASNTSSNNERCRTHQISLAIGKRISNSTLRNSLATYIIILYRHFLKMRRKARNDREGRKERICRNDRPNSVCVVVKEVCLLQYGTNALKLEPKIQRERRDKKTIIALSQSPCSFILIYIWSCNTHLQCSTKVQANMNSFTTRKSISRVYLFYSRHGFKFGFLFLISRPEFAKIRITPLNACKPASLFYRTQNISGRSKSTKRTIKAISS